MKSFVVRKATYHDISKLYAILQQSEHSWKKEMLMDCFKNQYQQWVIENDQTIIGFVIIHLLSECWEIMQIAVNIDFQRQGAAAQLLRHVMTEAKKKHIKNIQLEVRASNCAAICLYQKLGFTTTGIRKNYYLCSNNREDALLMDIKL